MMATFSLRVKGRDSGTIASPPYIISRAFTIPAASAPAPVTAGRPRMAWLWHGSSLSSAGCVAFPIG